MTDSYGAQVRAQLAEALAEAVELRRRLTEAEAERSEVAQISHQYRNVAERAEARIAAVRALAIRLAGHGSPWDGNEPAVAEELLAILDGPTGCTCSLLNGCDCGMPIHSEVLRGGRRIPGRPS